VADPKNVLADIWLLTSIGDALVAEGLADSTLSVDEFALYGLISDLGPVTATRLGGWTGMPSTTLSALIRRCERRGDLRRRPDPVDRRNSLIELTSQGVRTYSAALPSLSSALDRLNAELDVPQEQVRALLQKVDGALRATMELPARPYRVAEDPQVGDMVQALGLSASQAAELEEFGRWLKNRDEQRSGGNGGTTG
jgi:DNA-binding MarR family transcriptional regulator